MALIAKISLMYLLVELKILVGSELREMCVHNLTKNNKKRKLP